MSNDSRSTEDKLDDGAEKKEPSPGISDDERGCPGCGTPLRLCTLVQTKALVDREGNPIKHVIVDSKPVTMFDQHGTAYAFWLPHQDTCPALSDVKRAAAQRGEGGKILLPGDHGFEVPT